MFELLAREYPDLQDGDWSGAADQQRDVSDALDDLNPPPELEDKHNAFVRSSRDVADILAELEDGETISPGSAEADAILAWQDAGDALDTAFREHYGVLYFRNEGASMEPTMHHGDQFKVPTYDGSEIARRAMVVWRFHLVASGSPERWFREACNRPSR
jgi:hypothetical protein